MVRNAAAVLIIVTLVLGLLASRWGSSSTPAGMVEELARLRYANTLLQTKVQQYEARVEAADAGATAGSGGTEAHARELQVLERRVDELKRTLAACREVALKSQAESEPKSALRIRHGTPGSMHSVCKHS